MERPKPQPILVHCISEAAILEQLAEEASELAQAALKLARVLRKENPTPVSEEEARASLIEEYTDVILTSDVLNLDCDYILYAHKTERWVTRVNNSFFNGE